MPTPNVRDVPPTGTRRLGRELLVVGLLLVPAWLVLFVLPATPRRS